MHTRYRLICLLAIISLVLLPSQAQAASGFPGTPKFGYGIRIDLAAANWRSTLQTAIDLKLDWLALDFNWQEYQPDPGNPINWSVMDLAMQQVDNTQIAVLISITAAPHWAITASGPDPVLAGQLCQQLMERYRQMIQALEIFPGANTSQGWGVQPNPQAYVALLTRVSRDLEYQGDLVPLVGAGLQSPAPGDPDAVAFLQAIYAAGAREVMPIVGLHLPHLSSNPMQETQSTVQGDLRAYEIFRQVMLENGHEGGLIWVTAFNWNSGSIPAAEHELTWIKQAYLLMRAQLYLGAAFYQFKPAGMETIQQEAIIGEIGQIIALENNQVTVTLNPGSTRLILVKSHQKGITP